MRSLSLLFALLMSPIAFAQTTTKVAVTPAMSATGAFFALSVADLKASSQWYEQKLVMNIVMQVSKTPDQPAAVAVLEGGGLIVELIERPDSLPLAKAAPEVKGNIYVHGIFKAGFIVDDFDKTLAALKSRGIEIAFGPFPAKDKQRANVIIKDNSGNLIQLFAQ